MRLYISDKATLIADKKDSLKLALISPYTSYLTGFFLLVNHMNLSFTARGVLLQFKPPNTSELPPGWVGARCVESNCTHEQAKCSNGYCECVQGGLFYDLSVWWGFFFASSHTHTYTWTMIQWCICPNIHTDMYPYTDTCTHIYTYTHVHKYIHIHMLIDTYTYSDMHTHTHTYTYVT